MSTDWRFNPVLMGYVEKRLVVANNAKFVSAEKLDADLIWSQVRFFYGDFKKVTGTDRACCLCVVGTQLVDRTSPLERGFALRKGADLLCAGLSNSCFVASLGVAEVPLVHPFK